MKMKKKQNDDIMAFSFLSKPLKYIWTGIILLKVPEW